MHTSKLNSSRRTIDPKILLKFYEIEHSQQLEKIIDLNHPNDRMSQIYNEIKVNFDDEIMVKYFKFKMRQLTHVNRLRVYLFGKKNNIEQLVSECLKFFKDCPPDISNDTKLSLWDFKRTIGAIVLSGLFTENVLMPKLGFQNESLISSNSSALNIFVTSPIIHNLFLYTVVGIVGVTMGYFLDFKGNFRNPQNKKIREMHSLYCLEQSVIEQKSE